jgi:predicted extracellular nuclease
VKRENPRPLAPETCAPDRLRIAAFNVENYFSSLSGRGARNSAEQFAQQSKLKAAILALDADVLGLLELENDGGTTQAALRDALRIPERPDLDYAVAPEPSDVGDDRIRSALLYRPGRVGLVENGTFSDGSAVYERPPRAQGFSFAGRGLAVVLVHEKSKSCAGASAVQADLGEGCFNSCRTDQARELITFTRRVTDALGPRVVVMGDFNSYSKEQPLLLLEAAGFGDVLERLPASERYSFVFSGRAGLLDHLYASPELAADVTGQGIWHIDADEAPRLGYHGLGGEGFSLDPFRASDHDPIWLCTR